MLWELICSISNMADFKRSWPCHKKQSTVVHFATLALCFGLEVLLKLKYKTKLKYSEVLSDRQQLLS